MPKRTDATGAPGVSNAVVGPVMRALGEMGYLVSPPAGPSRSRPPVVDGPAADALIDDAAASLGDGTIGISLARRIPLGGLGDLDYGLCTSETLRDGLGLTARFYGVVTERVRLALVESPPHATLRFNRTTAARYSRHWAEFPLALIAERMRQTLGRQRVVFEEVSFAHPPPATDSGHDAFFGTKVHFDAPHDQLVFASELLGLPLLTASASLAEVLESRMRAVSPSLEQVDAFLVRVRQVTIDLLDVGETGLSATAARLGTSTRTLQRELRKRRTAHKELLDEVRRERAQLLLEQGGTIAEVARRLGFSEPSAFFRAFRRWTGTSPRATRGSGSVG
jgi:AraC-like DNA-binding protein